MTAKAAGPDSEARFRDSFDFAAVGIGHAAPDGRYLRVNRKLCEIVGYAREELLARTFQDITYPDDLDADLGFVQRVLTGDIESYTMEKRYVHKKGAVVWVNLSVSLVRRPDGGPAYFLSIVEDITARKRAEEELRETQTALERLLREADEARREAEGARGLLKGVIERVSDAFVALDNDWRYTYVNQRAAEVLQRRRPEELVGRHIWTEYPEGVGQPFHQAYLRACETQQPVVLEEHYEPWDRWFENRIYPSKDGLTIYFTEVTERKRAEDALRRLNAELEARVQERTAELRAKNRELETFTYSVSHDLKAPLRGIDGYSRLLLEDHADALDEEGRTFLHNVRRAATQMSRLIDDLLAYSRLERRRLHPERIELRTLVDSVLADRADELRTRGVSLAVGVPEVVVSVDRQGLALAVRNLVDNALKFTGDAEGPRLEIGGRVGEATCLLWVRDNGIGFDMKFHDRIFEVFQRLHRAEDYPGSGVGLAMVRTALLRMGGRAWAESEPGKGATFFLDIPRERP